MIENIIRSDVEARLVVLVYFLIYNTIRICYIFSLRVLNYEENKGSLRSKSLSFCFRAFHPFLGEKRLLLIGIFFLLIVRFSFSVPTLIFYRVIFASLVNIFLKALIFSETWGWLFDPFIFVYSLFFKNLVLFIFYFLFSGSFKNLTICFIKLFKHPPSLNIWRGRFGQLIKMQKNR